MIICANHPSLLAEGGFSIICTFCASHQHDTNISFDIFAYNDQRSVYIENLWA